MKKIIFLSIASLFFVAVSHAQSADTSATKQHKAWHKKGGEDDFNKKMNYTDDQKTQMKAIKDNQKSKIAAIKSNASLSADQKKEQIKQANTDAYNKRQALYTPEQKALIKEDHEKRKAQKKDDTSAE